MTDALVSAAPDGNRLLGSDQKPFFAIIVNYVGHPDRAWQQFADGRFDPDLIEADFRLARSLGANTIRTFVGGPLNSEFPKGKWAKLDAVVEAAQRAGVYLLLTLADYSVSYVQTLAAHAGLIAGRYAGHPAILACDLKNEPRFYNLALLHYTRPAPLLSPELAAAYPQQQSEAQALAWARGEGRVPAWVSDEDAIRYAYAHSTWNACLGAASEWISARNYAVTVAEFIRSPEAEPWRPFLDALNETLNLWLTPQLEAVRATDPRRLVTVGWSDPLLAALPANAALDFLSLHRYPPMSPRWLDYHLSMARALRSAFPNKPVMLTEFGFPAQESDPAQAAVAESAAWLRAYEWNLAGAGKWMLWDLPPGPNPRERSFGLLAVDGRPKPSGLALAALSERLARSSRPRGQLILDSSPQAPLTYRFAADDARFAGGPEKAGDEVARWEGQGTGQLFVDWTQPGRVRVRATAPGLVTLDLGKMLGLTRLGTYTLEADGAPVGHSRSEATLQFPVQAGRTVTCRLALQAVDARIAILWPHGNAPVSEARLANLTAYLTFPDSRVSVPCDFAPRVTLWRAVRNEPAQPIAVGVRRLAEVQGRRVPAWDFNDVDVSLARDPLNKLYFTVRVEGMPCRSNVWVHGRDARTILPQQVRPEGVLPVTREAVPSELDARIQIVWPHEGAPVAQADLANVTADLFGHNSAIRLSPHRPGADMWQPDVWLVRAVNNEVGQRVAKGVIRWEPGTGVEHGTPGAPVSARWDFNNVDVSPARNPANKVHLWVEVEGVVCHTNFWTHGADARTHLPDPEVPLGDCS